MAWLLRSIVSPLLLIAMLVVLAGSCSAISSSLTCDEDSILGLTEVMYHSEPSHIYLGSPSILRLRSGDLLATADRFGSGFQTARNVSLYRSTNNGSSWHFHTWVLGMYWANLFEHSGRIYLLGTDGDGHSNIKISMSEDGLSWPVSQQAILFNGSYQTGPTPTLLSSTGRLSRAMERLAPPYRWGVDYQVAPHCGSPPPLALIQPYRLRRVSHTAPDLAAGGGAVRARRRFEPAAAALVDAEHPAPLRHGLAAALLGFAAAARVPRGQHGRARRRPL
eukprot:COSAG01_NODE_1108_length_11662_cov_189.275534_17_plen_278_part_00